MGLEARCIARSGTDVSEGKALLETDALIFRGALRLSIPLQDIRAVKFDDGCLTLSLTDRVVTLELGPAAEKWAKKILHPPQRIDKLGVKPGQRIAVVNVSDPTFAEEIAALTTDVTSKPNDETDLIFVGGERKAALKRLSALQTSLKSTGAIWVVYPKGVAQITEADVLSAGRAVGLVDTKVVRFSATHTALKFVIPVNRR
jgi:hypothetical protein